IRELKVAAVGEALASVFEDIDAMAKQCRFSDCSHEYEPDCAVRTAIENGTIDARRLQNYLKLKRENERNTASLAAKRLRDRAFGKLLKEVKAMKQHERDGN